jgi:hypothetical protein
MQFIIEKDRLKSAEKIFYLEKEAYSGVIRVANKVIEDIERVMGTKPEATQKISKLGEYPVIYGTIGHSEILDDMQKKGKINLSAIEGKREVFMFQLVEKPYKGISCALVIAGSDKRGTIYGLFHLSECMGVSPLVDWSDVRPKRKEKVVLTEKDNKVSKEPSVKYRGIFINDEWPAFGNWSKTHFGGFNAKMYDHVFELILRLKGNYLWPAMWTACFSCDGPGLLNAELANEYGIVLGSSHHEPCIRNGEEYSQVRGKDSIYGDAWDFRTNREGILRFWEDGLKRNGKLENIITLGMRGEQDSKLLGEKATIGENIELLRDVIREQNRLIRENVCEDLSKTKRVFVLFTEVEEFFYGNDKTKGLIGDKELDGVTLMLGDDNFGNLRSVPTQEMLQHDGGYGLYYHFDFHGGAHAYDWMNTNYLPKVWEQLTMAYDYGIQDIWVVNIGDICFLEYPISYFFELAYDMEKWGSSKPNMIDFYTKQWINRQFDSSFNEEDKQTIQEILNGYTRINHNRKPEVLNASVYHPVHFEEAENLLIEAKTITQKASELIQRCKDWTKPSFYELIYFPAVASMNVQRMQILAGRNEFYARQNRAETNDLAKEIKWCIEEDRRLTKEFHEINNGKWDGMGLSEHIGFVHWNEEGNRYPLMIQIELANKPRLILAKSDSCNFTEGFIWTRKTITIEDFLRPDINEIKLELACGSKEAVEYEVKCDCLWLTPSKLWGCVDKKEILLLNLDRRLLNGKEIGTILIQTKTSEAKIEVWAENTDVLDLNVNTFLERNGYIAMEAEHYSFKHDVEGYCFTLLEGYGRTLSAMKVLPPKHDFTNVEDRPFLEYHFVAEQEGEYTTELYLAPSNTAYMDHKLALGIQINEGEIQIENAVSENFRSLDLNCMEWISGVMNNIRIHQSSVKCQKGLNRLRIYAVSPFMVLEKIVLYSKGTKIPESYLGPNESYYKNKEIKSVEDL